MDWTKEQNDAIYKKDSNILVAAAAGSGKTAVLVERIIQKILKDNVDIDKLLVVTFTNAAAAEMRERVLDAIYKKLEENPDDSNLERQMVLLGKSNICTIHSFCLDVIKNNFFEVEGLSASFRIGLEEENELLKQEVLEDTFEKLYEEENKDFEKLVDTYTDYRGDESLKELILKVFSFMQSNPFPNKWLEEKIDMFNISNISDFSETIWGEILLANLREEILDAINNLKVINNDLIKFYELDKFRLAIDTDIESLKAFYDITKSSWDETVEFLPNFSFVKWPVDKKVTLELKDEAYKNRNKIKENLLKKLKKILVYNSKNALKDITEMYDVLNIFKNVVLEFSENFKNKKLEKNILDFNDIEHYALKILINEDGIPTEVAKKYQEKFVEIAIDEYQDSNKVQELILNSVSKQNNIFMVGDIKQSIYKFRQACPDLFLKKYKSYSLNNSNENGLKIQLFKNFRSRENILKLTNEIFKNIMSEDLGDINYTEEEYLNLGADFEPNENVLDISELDIIDLNDENNDIWKEEKLSEENDDNDEESEI